MSRPWTGETLLEMARAYQPACVLLAAAELDVFGALAREPMTAEALAAAAWVADRGGGRGAVRDLCEHLLRQMGKWDEAAARFLS